MLSIILPVYNAAPYLCQCLDSIIIQSYLDIEILCIDDGSTDNSLNILHTYQQKENRIKVFHQDHLGAGSARNLGIKKAQGTYIQFLDADDFLSPDALQSLNDILTSTPTDVCMFNYYYYDNQTKEVEKKYLFQKVMDDSTLLFECSFKDNYKLFLYNSVVPWNKIYRRQFLLQYHIVFDHLICSNDRYFYFQIVKLAKSILLYNNFLVYYRINNINSLIGLTRQKHFDCMFKSYYTIRTLFENESSEIKDALIDITIKDILRFYHNSPPSMKWNIFNLVHDFFQELESSTLNFLENNYCWYDEFTLIKTSTFIKNVPPNKIIPIVLSVTNTTFLYGQCVLQSILSTINKNYFYDIYLFESNLPQRESYKFHQMVNGNSNIALRSINLTRYIKWNPQYRNSSTTMYYIPHLLHQYSNVLYIKPTILFLHDFSGLYFNTIIQHGLDISQNDLRYNQSDDISTSLFLVDIDKKQYSCIGITPNSFSILSLLKKRKPSPTVVQLPQIDKKVGIPIKMRNLHFWLAAKNTPSYDYMLLTFLPMKLSTNSPVKLESNLMKRKHKIEQLHSLYTHQSFLNFLFFNFLWKRNY